ncbi:transmembrane protein 199 [Nasonia vitripennis]|uniref:Transmembrane protein 199 n=1 Tax=Nasonia vitripennis TaxID=7425 RepID=A0A7M7QII8_NASVI|nr:transmembrane protein 199 [Nasonia vitripennis]XP_008205780.1 transmembrane protein 199 [Nasonia vitripennis]XP_008205783.1 transmembrane protein 199 [Nasonia vitripennis]XP_031787117.1 transmembrane protein 199 [Nasonia vitripennis]
MPLETIEDHHIKIKPTSKLIDFIVKDIKSAKDLPENIGLLKNSHQNKRHSCLLTLNDIKWLKSYVLEQRDTSNSKVYIHQLLEGVDIILPEPKVTPRNPELEARIKKLQAQQDARDYQAMTKGVDNFRKHIPEDTIAFQMKLMNKQLIAVAQFVFSVMAGFAFGFIGVELIVGNLDFGFRLLLGVICSIVIALAEIYFLAKKLSEDYEDTPTRSVPKKLHQE